MSNQRKGKFVITTAGDVKPLFMTNEQWAQVSEGLRNGAFSITTNQDAYMIYGVLEVAKGYESQVVSAGSEAVVMIFSEKEKEDSVGERTKL